MSGFTGEDEASASKESADAAVVATNSTPAAAEEIANVSSKHFVFYQWKNAYAWMDEWMKILLSAL